MKVGIIGLGFVGTALLNAIDKDVEVLKVDPILGTNINDLSDFNPDICFICVPTPMNEDGSQDISILEGVIYEICKYELNSTIVLKSTILPNHIKFLENATPNIVINPEFLRERSANADFINSKLIILGGQEKNTSIIADFYRNHTACKAKDYQFTDLASASLIKYAINTFLATKVIFFNQLHNIFKESDTQEKWETLIDIISMDNRIGSSHMQVPGIDGKLGFGGPCFPKDCSALIKYSNDINKPFELLEKARIINNKIRRDYDVLSDREIEQNINYND